MDTIKKINSSEINIQTSTLTDQHNTSINQTKRENVLKIIDDTKHLLNEGYEGDSEIDPQLPRSIRLNNGKSTIYNTLPQSNTLLDVIRKKKNKKFKRNIRMNSNSIAINAALAEKNGYGNNYSKAKNFTLAESDNKHEIKINRSNNLLQKNILTGSRSSFVKSTLKP